MNRSFKLRDIIITIGIALLILIGIEFVAGLYVSRRFFDEADAALLQKSHLDFEFLSDGFNFNEIDPLLGWAMPLDQLNELGWTVDNNCIYLENRASDTSAAFTIFITGGSTTDLAINPSNWPILLHHEFVERQINSRIYVGAVAGFGSSQEVLKLIRDGVSVKPDLHISYSGVNEVHNPYFVSPQEQRFYHRAIFNSRASRIMPYSTFLLRSWFQRDKNRLILSTLTADPTVQWQENMRLMHGLAVGLEYDFIGLLQPVLSYDANYETDVSAPVLADIEDYSQFYPEALKHVANTPYLHDLTGIFDSAKGKVFIDDCHVHDDFQYIIANTVFELIGQIRNDAQN